MSTFDVLRRYGTWALLKVTAAVLTFVVLHLIRIPLVIAAAVLEGVMRRVDGYATRQTAAPPTRPLNQFFACPNTADRKEERGVHI